MLRALVLLAWIAAPPPAAPAARTPQPVPAAARLTSTPQDSSRRWAVTAIEVPLPGPADGSQRAIRVLPADSTAPRDAVVSVNGVRGPLGAIITYPACAPRRDGARATTARCVVTVSAVGWRTLTFLSPAP